MLKEKIKERAKGVSLIIDDVFAKKTARSTWTAWREIQR